MDEIEMWKKAGELTWEAIEYGKKIIKPGKTYLEVAEEIEKFIRKKGDTAFPPNLSRNKEAAHYSPGIDDKRVIEENDLIKLDLGAQIDGYIGDSAVTIDLSGENSKLVEASETALENAISLIRSGQDSIKVSQEIERTIKSFGFEPIRNLGGHVISRWILHTGYSVPNAPSTNFKFQEGMIVAIEPFASTGRGLVHDGPETTIFMIEGKLRARSPVSRRIYQFALERFKTLPFNERYLLPVANKFQIRVALRELAMNGSFHPYPVLVDTGLVSQREVTLLVEKDSAVVLTK